jgi:hypothetical protein
MRLHVYSGLDDTYDTGTRHGLVSRLDTGLVWLTLNANRFTGLPEEICSMTALVRLSLHINLVLSVDGVDTGWQLHVSHGVKA